MAEANVLNTFQCGFESHRGHMEITKILDREHTTTRFEIFQADSSLWLRCSNCDLWMTDTEFARGWVELDGCVCTERDVHADTALKNAGIVLTRKYDAAGEVRSQYIEFMKALSAPQFSLENILDNDAIKDTPLIYQWIAFWAGVDVLDLSLNFQES